MAVNVNELGTVKELTTVAAGLSEYHGFRDTQDSTIRYLDSDMYDVLALDINSDQLTTATIRFSIVPYRITIAGVGGTYTYCKKTLQLFQMRTYERNWADCDSNLFYPNSGIASIYFMLSGNVLIIGAKSSGSAKTIYLNADIWAFI